MQHLRNHKRKIIISRVIYRDNIFLPYVAETRKDYHRWNVGDPIPTQLSAVSWSDGDLCQIQNIVSEDSLEVYRDNMIIANK